MDEEASSPSKKGKVPSKLKSTRLINKLIEDPEKKKILAHSLIKFQHLDRIKYRVASEYLMSNHDIDISKYLLKTKSEEILKDYTDKDESEFPSQNEIIVEEAESLVQNNGPPSGPVTKVDTLSKAILTLNSNIKRQTSVLEKMMTVLTRIEKANESAPGLKFIPFKGPKGTDG